MTRRISGVFDDDTARPLTSATIVMPAMDMVVEWRRCGMTADYLADYLAYGFERRDVARSVISTAANELLENAAKFTSDKRTPVRVVGRLRGASVEVEVENVAEAKHVETLTALLDALSRGQAPTLFAARLESQERGGLGLIVLAKDYAARLGAQIVAIDNDAPHETFFNVMVRASIAADQVEQP